VGWIGCGVMGRSMCQRLIDANFAVTLYTRTKEKARPLIDAGAGWADTPQLLAEKCDLIFSIVGFPADVRQVHLGDRGTLAGCRKGNVIVDMTTSRPELAVEIYRRAAAQGVAAIDAPVSGGDVGARNGTLSIMIGGDRQVADRLQPIWAVLGKSAVYQGRAGSGQHAKMVNQILIATNMIGVCEALVYAYRAGLDLETVLQSVSGGAAASWSLSNLAPRIIENNFDPGFFVDHFVKDMEIAIDEANRMGLELPGLALAQQLYAAVQAKGDGRQGTQALQKTIASLSGIDWTGRSSNPRYDVK
jgi:3-hydroxyisobutyrate dehydrogenase